MVNDSSVMTAVGLVGDNIYGMGNKLTRIHDKLHLLFLKNSENLVMIVFHDTLEMCTGPATQKTEPHFFLRTKSFILTEIFY